MTIYKVIICGDTRQAAAKCKLAMTDLFSTFPTIRKTRIVSRNEIVEDFAQGQVITRYVSVGSNSLDGLSFDNITIDSTAVTDEHIKELHKVLDILVSSQIGGHNHAQES